MRSLRLLHLLQRPPDVLGGTERQAALLVRHLRARGHEVEILASPWAAAHAARVLASRPDLVHAHLLSGHAAAALLAARPLGIPVVVKVGASRAHGDVATSRATRLGRAKLALAVRRAAGWIAPNEECADELRDAGVVSDRVRVIPNGVDLARFRPHTHPITPVVLFAGRLALQKGIDRLVEAWPIVAAARPDARLLVAGDGPLRTEAERFARGRTDVEILDPVPDLASVFVRARVFVLPSRAEGVSNALLEAMAAGLAPVATRIGGNKEVIEGGGGVLVDGEDPKALAEAVLMALKDSETIGSAARGRVEARYGVEATASRVESLYLDILAELPYNLRR